MADVGYGAGLRVDEEVFCECWGVLGWAWKGDKGRATCCYTSRCYNQLVSLIFRKLTWQCIPKIPHLSVNGSELILTKLYYGDIERERKNEFGPVGTSVVFLLPSL